MSYKQIIFATAVFVLVGTGCSKSVSSVPAVRTTESSVTVPAETAVEPGSWIPATDGPWNGALYLATSSDGLSFSGGIKIFAAAGVPNLLRLTSGSLILTYQYFSSTDQEMFDRISYSISNDNGKTWTDPAAVNITNLPAPQEARLKPMDPTLVQLADGSLRLYFTYHAKGNRTAALYEATAATGNVSDAFVANATPSLVLAKNLLDPSVVFFNNSWNHYSWQMESDANYHSTSADGVTFALQTDVILPMDFLGQVVPMQGGLRMYGTGKGLIQSAFSLDGNAWSMDAGNRIPQGADPGVVALSDGTYLMIYTGKNFNE